MTETAQFDFELARRNMAENQVRTWEVLSLRVLDLLEEMPREDFVPPRYRKVAYSDTGIPIGHGQVMFTPKIEGRILQAVYPQHNETVLEIGTGSGFLTACLARMARSVTSVDVFDDFREAAGERIDGLGLGNVALHTENAAHGLEREARFDVVVVGAALPEMREDFHRHVRDGGRLFLIVGRDPIMEGWLFTRLSGDTWTSESLFDTRVPHLIDPGRRPDFEF